VCGAGASLPPGGDLSIRCRPPCIRRLPSHRAAASPTSSRRLDKRVGALCPLLADGLIAQGVLERRRNRIPLVGGTRRPVVRPAVHGEVLQRLQLAAATDGVFEPRTALLLALSRPAGLLKVVALQRADRDLATRRNNTASQRVPAAAVVMNVLAEMQAAVALAARAGGAGAG
jgi:hypothetical protein